MRLLLPSTMFLAFLTMSSGIAAEKVGLVWPIWEEATSTLYYGEIFDLVGDPNCSMPTPTYYWADNNAEPCPWESCPTDIVFEKLPDRNEEALRAPFNGTYQGKLPSKLQPQGDDLLTQLGKFPRRPRTRTIGSAPQTWSPLHGLPVAGQKLNQDLAMKITDPSNGAVKLVPVRWFTATPNRVQAGLPDNPRHNLDKPIHVGFQLNVVTEGLPVVDGVLHSKSPHQASFKVRQGNDVFKVVVITYDALR